MSSPLSRANAIAKTLCELRKKGRIERIAYGRVEAATQRKILDVLEAAEAFINEPIIDTAQLEREFQNGASKVRIIYRDGTLSKFNYSSVRTAKRVANPADMVVARRRPAGGIVYEWAVV